MRSNTITSRPALLQKQRLAKAKKAFKGLKTPYRLIRDHRIRQQLKIHSLGTTSPLGAYCSSKEIEDLAKCCSIVRFAEKRELWESPFYLVLEGEVGVVSAVGGLLCTRAAGSFFSRHAGEGVLSSDVNRQQNARSAEIMAATPEAETTLLCRTPVLVLLVTAEYALQQFLERCSASAFRGYDAIISTNLATRLNRVEFIKEAGLRVGDLTHLGELCSYIALNPGDFVYKRGDFADCAYIVLEGQVETQLSDPVQPTTAKHGRPSIQFDHDSLEGVGATLHKAAKYTGGATFGIAALVIGSPQHMSSVVCTERTLLVAVSEENFDTFLALSESLKASVMLMSKRHILSNFSRLPGNIFHSFSSKELEKAALSATIERLSAGKTVYSTGEAARAFFIVARGAVAFEIVSADGVRQKRSLGVGAYFGEMGVLMHRTRCLSTVTVEEETTLLAISTEDWQRLFPSSMVADAAHGGVGQPRRNLTFTMELHLLLKLRQTATPLDALLMHPTSQAAFTPFIIRELRGVIRPVVVNAAFELLQACHRTAALEHSASVETLSALRDELLLDQAHRLVKLLGRLPCPRRSPSPLSSPAADGDDEELAVPPPALVEALATKERRFVDLLPESIRSLPPSAEEVLSEILADMPSSCCSATSASSSRSTSKR